MRSFIFILCALFVTACGQSKSEAQITTIDEVIEPVKQAPKSKETEFITLSHVRIIKDPKFKCQGVFEQGGTIQCDTYPNAIVEIDGIRTKADQDGFVILGFDRDAPTQEKILVRVGNESAFGKTFEIAPHTYAVSRIDGLPPSQVSTFTEA